jgi:hypothetical protein
MQGAIALLVPSRTYCRRGDKSNDDDAVLSGTE